VERDSIDGEEDLARWVTAQVAPEEEELFGVINDAYRADPDRFAAGGKDGDEMLGFGVEAVAALMTPVVLAAVAEVARYLATQVGDAVRVRLWLRRGRPAPAAAVDVDVPRLDDTQLAHVREIVLGKCAQAGVENGRSQLLADSVVGALRANG